MKNFFDKYFNFFCIGFIGGVIAFNVSTSSLHHNEENLLINLNTMGGGIPITLGSGGLGSGGLGSGGQRNDKPVKQSDFVVFSPRRKLSNSHCVIPTTTVVPQATLSSSPIIRPFIQSISTTNPLSDDKILDRDLVSEASKKDFIETNISEIRLQLESLNEFGLIEFTRFSDSQDLQLIQEEGIFYSTDLNVYIFPFKQKNKEYYSLLIKRTDGNFNYWCFFTFQNQNIPKSKEEARQIANINFNRRFVTQVEKNELLARQQELREDPLLLEQFENHLNVSLTKESVLFFDCIFGKYLEFLVEFDDQTKNETFVTQSINEAFKEKLMSFLSDVLEIHQNLYPGVPLESLPELFRVFEIYYPLEFYTRDNQPVQQTVGHIIPYNILKEVGMPEGLEDFVLRPRIYEVFWHLLDLISIEARKNSQRKIFQTVQEYLGLYEKSDYSALLYNRIPLRSPNQENILKSAVELAIENQFYYNRSKILPIKEEGQIRILSTISDQYKSPPTPV